MKLFTNHPHGQGISYIEHWRFAMGVAYRLLKSAAAFALHAILPFISIDTKLDLEATAAHLTERNRWIGESALLGHLRRASMPNRTHPRSPPSAALPAARATGA